MPVFEKPPVWPAPRHAFERELTIRFAHCDPAGIVFFPQYFVMLNNLVEDWFTEGLGLPYAHLLGPRRLGLPTVRLSSDFTAPSRMGERVALGLTLERLGAGSITLELGCRCGDEPRMRARQVLVCTSLDSMKAVAIPEDVHLALAAYAARHPPAA
ncbi:acyl-CoA thioesterase [Aquabacterium sp. A7-Y]|uniref:acyl-CoA thioesterase n=1 Tax=Aquabacterium sp. A7-Y TaxID=1349605 RepID=UPI00223DBECF|nr:thioesterase family protein [Aquabacterium sp. A7-Y]MCW7537761.1 acyl-CoA thioesterase [Aquabacterium sp. A7-Y]